MKLLVFDWTFRKIIEISAGPLIEALTWFHFSSATPKLGEDFWLFCKPSLKPNHLRLLKINNFWVVSSMSNVIKSFRVCAWLWRGYAIAHGGSLCWAFLHSPFVALVRWHLGSQFARRNSFGCSCWFMCFSSYHFLSFGMRCAYILDRCFVDVFLSLADSLVFHEAFLLCASCCLSNWISILRDFPVLRFRMEGLWCNPSPRGGRGGLERPHALFKIAS